MGDVEVGAGLVVPQGVSQRSQSYQICPSCGADCSAENDEQICWGQVSCLGPSQEAGHACEGHRDWDEGRYEKEEGADDGE